MQETVIENGVRLIKQTFYYENGNIKKENYFFNNERHREDGPAEIYYRRDGGVSREFYFKNDKLHREGGPAQIIYYVDLADGFPYYCRTSYFINGKEITDEFQIMVIEGLGNARNSN